MTTGKQGEINVTPMIDVMLVLMIIFMVIIPQKSTGLPSQLPQPGSSANKERPLDIVVSVGENHDVTINTEPVAWANLDRRLQQIAVARPGGTLFIEGSPRADFADVAQVLDTARGAWIPKFALMPRKRR
jgi:biopolymer transport protein TolR